MSKLDEGFEEVPLDDGFEEISLDQPKSMNQKAADFWLKPVSEDNTKNLKAAQLGLSEGITLGHTGEMLGGTDYIADLVMKAGNKIAPSIIPESPTQVSAKLTQEGFTGDIGPTTSKELYRQSADEAEKKILQARKESPKSFIGGQLAGGLLSGIATGGYGASKIAPVAAKALGATETGFIAAGKQGLLPFTKAVATEAAGAVPMGAMLGHGEARPDENQLLATGKGALEMSAGAIAFKLGAEGIPFLAKRAAEGISKGLDDIFKSGPDSSTFKKQLENVYEAEREGKRILNREFTMGEGQLARERGYGKEITNPNSIITAEFQDDAKKIASDVFQNDTNLSQKIGDVIKQATKEGKTIDLLDKNVTTALQDFAEKVNITNPNIGYNKTLQYIKSKLSSGNYTFTPAEVQDIKVNLSKLARQLQEDSRLDVKELSQTAQNLSHSISNSLSTLPEYKKAITDLAVYRRGTIEPILSGYGVDSLIINGQNVPIGKAIYYADDISENRKQFTDIITELIDRMYRKGVGGEELSLFNKYGKTLTPVENQTGLKVTDLYKQIDDAAVRRQTLTDIHKIEPLSPEYAIRSASPKAAVASMVQAGITKRALLNAAGLAGRLQHGVNNGQISKEFQPVLDKLNKAFQENDGIAKNALLNTLFQNRAIRKYLDEVNRNELGLQNEE